MSTKNNSTKIEVATSKNATIAAFVAVDQEAIDRANRWDNRTVEILGKGGKIQVRNHDGSVFTAHTPKTGATSRFVIRASQEIPGTISLQVVSDDDDNDNNNNHRYLTVPMYGDECRQEAAQALAEIPDLLADTIPSVVDFAIGNPTAEDNFEGSGFNYSPISTSTTKSTTRPNKLQLFRLVEPNPRRTRYQFGLQSLFGTYWRSQHWNKTVSQSPHLLADETWTFQEVATK